MARRSRSCKKRHCDRGIDYRRTEYRPGLMICSCESCFEKRSGAAFRRKRTGERYPDCQEKNPECCYVNREKIFADHWEKENRRQPGINYGNGILQDLMVTQREAKRGDAAVRNHRKLWGWLRVAFLITPRERVIVATVIQWLGTNCGWCFLERCVEACGYRLIRKEEASRKRAA